MYRPGQYRPRRYVIRRHYVSLYREPWPAWLRGVINFSGGVTDVATKAGDTSHLPTSLNGNMVNGLKILGISSHIPTLWLYTENDSHYSIKTIKASHRGVHESWRYCDAEAAPSGKGGGRTRVRWPAS